MVAGSSPPSPAIIFYKCSFRALFVINALFFGKEIMNLNTHFRNAKTELSKVIFPTKGQVKQAYIAVVIVVTVISIFLALVDLAMSSFMSAILG
ncbi:preprotein translocase subunit SecE [bacterium]|nr:preprotein translocase subunit SecE [bacterium]MBU1993644.1 preprotein translocase subunit SecE [bacterium]